MSQDTIIALAAAFISLCALGVALWQGYATRVHNRLSVKPILHFNIGLVGNDYILSLHNAGFGPAVITGWEESFENKKLGSNSFEISVNLQESLEVQHFQCEVYVPGILQAMPAGGSYELLKVSGIGIYEKDFEKLQQDIYSLEIEVQFESIYGESFQVSGPDFA